MSYISQPSFHPRHIRSNASVSLSARRTERKQGVLPLTGNKRTGARKVRKSDEVTPIGNRLAKLVLFISTVLILANAIAGDQGLIQTAMVRSKYEQLSDSVARLQDENRKLAVQAARLRHDVKAIEKLARDDLGLIRPGERLFIVTGQIVPGP